MELVWSSEKFKINGLTYEKFPILLNDSMESLTEVNSFLRYYLIQRGRIQSNKSWKVVGQALYDYFGFLQAQERKWNENLLFNEVSLLSTYRDYSLRKLNLSRSTVRQRLCYLCKFYEYSVQCGFIDKLPFQYETVRSIRNLKFLAHTDATGGELVSKDILPKISKLLPKFLSKSQVGSLLNAVDNRHHMMIVRFFLQSGLRRQELATFPLIYIVNPKFIKTSTKNMCISLNPHDGNEIKTKGSKARNIWISRELMSELWNYVIHIRGERSQLSKSPQKQLFLNQFGEGYSDDGKRIERIVRASGNKAGFRVSPHMLRHTYATHTLHYLQQGNHTIEPLVFLQNQLGHSSIQTVMIYTHLINSVVEDAVFAYDDEINDLCNSLEHAE